VQEVDSSALRTAIVADYLNQRGGAEWVVAVLHEIFPHAPIYTTIVDPARLWPALRDADIRPSWMQHLPGLTRHFKKYLPFYYLAIERMNLQEYDLVISSSCAFGLGAKARAGAVHVCYCHTPARFIWDYDRYTQKEQIGPVARRALPLLIRVLKRWDLAMSRRPHRFSSNSADVARRIRRHYGRTSTIIHPPVDIGRFSTGTTKGEYYLVVSRLNPYKRIELAVEAFNALGRPLIIIGEGPHRVHLERLAKPNIHFAGWLSDRDVAQAYAGCRALVFPGEEDFGIAVVEANASGRPVVAYRGGGTLDTVVEGITGVFFDQPTPEALIDAVGRLEMQEWDAAGLRDHAKGFGVDEFKRRFRAFVGDTVSYGDVGARVACV